jgi:exonuclease III
MRLLSLNVWDGRVKDKLIPFIADSAECTDIFCFQEVLNVSDRDYPEWRRAIGFGDSFAKGTVADGRIFGAMKGALAGFRPFLTAPYADGGVRLATFVSDRMKPVSSETHPLRVEQRQRVRGRDIWAKPILQCTRIACGRRQYNIVTFHGLWVYRKWHCDTPRRFEQSRAIIEYISGLKGETVLCGDFNLTPNTKSLRMLEESGLRNLVKEFGIRSTRTKAFWHSRDLFADYIMVSKGIKVEDFGVLDEAVSDHLPLYLDFH